MKVAFTLEQCWHAVPGGTAVAAIELARALLEREDVELIGVSARHRAAPPEPWRPPLPVRALPLPRLALYEAWHLLRRPSVERATGRVDVIHATGIAMPPATGPIVSTVHDLAYLDHPEMFSRAGLRFFRRALELTLADATLVLCSSQATLRRCREAGFEERRLRHVPLGVSVAPVTEEQVRATRARFGLDRDYVLWTGTIEPRKNLRGLLRAFERVDAPVELALVGPAGWSEDLEAVLGSLPGPVRARIHRLGWVQREELAALYAGASVFRACWRGSGSRSSRRWPTGRPSSRRSAPRPRSWSATVRASRSSLRTSPRSPMPSRGSLRTETWRRGSRGPDGRAPPRTRGRAPRSSCERRTPRPGPDSDVHEG